MQRIALSAVISILSIQSVQALAIPELNGIPYAFENDNDEAVNYDFTGIVALSNCSGSLVRFDDSVNTDKALVLTNGHCVQMLNDGVVLVNQPSTKTFNVLSSNASVLGKVTAQTLLYATMTKTDVGLYQLKETYQDILSKYKIPAYTLAKVSPALNTDIQVISGYWKRGYSCKTEANVYQLKEGGWTFENSVRYSRPGCEVIGGTSGSPVIATGTRTVIAINNTINESGYQCEVNNPCEIDKEGNIFYERGIGYSQQTYWFYSCRNATGNFDLTVSGCILPKPKM